MTTPRYPTSNHIMVDLETADNVATAAIVSIGAVIFAGPRAGETFYTAVDLQSSLTAGLTMSVDTMQWWGNQSAEARAVFDDPMRVPLVEALAAFDEFVPEGAKVWGNGASFDNAILAMAYRLCGLDLPWKFWDDRCYRTVAAHLPRRVQQGTHHNALDDAISQADHLTKHGQLFIK